MADFHEEMNEEGEEDVVVERKYKIDIFANKRASGSFISRHVQSIPSTLIVLLTTAVPVASGQDLTPANFSFYQA